MKKPLEKLILSFLLITLLSALGACSYRPRPVRTEDGEILFRLGFSGKPDSLNPYTAASQEADAVFSLLYDTLFTTDPVSGEIIPSLCTAYSIRDSAAGGKVWRITLPENVRWHDGELLTASDVEFSLQSLKELSVFYGYPYCELLDVTGIDVEDDLHLSMVVWGEEEQILSCLARIPVLPRHIWNKAEYMDYGRAGICSDLKRALAEIGKTPVDADTMVGSGIYRWGSYADGVCTLRLNREYWNGEARAEALEMHFGIKDTASALKEGSIDGCWDMSLRNWQQLAQEKGIKVTAGTAGELYMLYYNHADSPLGEDFVLRRAVEMCINRQAILLMAFGGGFADRGMVSPFSPWYYTPKLTYDRRYSISEAADALETAGYTDRDSNGYRERPNGYALEMKLVYSSADPSWETAAKLIQADCAQAGIKLALQPMPLSDLLNTVTSGQYDMLLYAEDTDPEPWKAWKSFYWDDGENLSNNIKDERAGFISRGWNFSGYASRDFDAAYEKLLSAEDVETRKACMLRAGQILYDDAAATSIGFHVRYQAHSTVWYSFGAGKTDGLYFTPSTLRTQIQLIDCAK